MVQKTTNMVKKIQTQKNEQFFKVPHAVCTLDDLNYLPLSSTLKLKIGYTQNKTLQV